MATPDLSDLPDLTARKSGVKNRRYKDLDGSPITLNELFKKDPAWCVKYVANLERRVVVLEKKLGEATGKIEKKPSNRRPRNNKYRKKSDRQNGVVRPARGTSSAMIWGRLDRERKRLGRPPIRRHVVNWALAKGIPKATSACAITNWRKYHRMGSYMSKYIDDRDRDHLS